MEPAGSMHDGHGNGVVNMTRAMEALSPWLKHPRREIIQVEVLVLAAAALLLLQLVLGSCRRRWRNSFITYGLQVCNGIMFPLIVYTLGTMQSSPVKNSSYPVWAGFLIMASAGTTVVRQYDFCGSFYNKYVQVCGEIFRDLYYVAMFFVLLDPNTFNGKTAWDQMQRGGKNSRASSICVMALVGVVILTKYWESAFSVASGYETYRSLFITEKKKSRGTRTQVAEHDSDPQSMKGYKYAVCYSLCGGGLITIDQIWDSCGSSADDGNALKELCLSYALSKRLWRQRYFGLVSAQTTRSEDRDFVFKKLLPPAQEYFQRAFKVIEVELGFCYDFFFTKYYNTFFWTNFLPVPFIQSFVLLKIILILVVGVIAIRKSLVLETPNPIIEVQISQADYIITLLVLSIAFLVDLAHAAFYLASNWAQVSLACMYVKTCCRQPKAYLFGKFIGLLRWVMISQKLRNKIDQHSVIFGPEQRPDPVKVSDAMKKAIARSLRSAYANNLTTDEEISVRLQNQMLDEYSWALNNLSELEVIFIWHIATEYCNAISCDPNNGNNNGTTPSSNHRGGHLFGYVLRRLRPDPRRNRIASDSHGGVAVHLSRYYAYLMGYVPELLPYHKVDIAELAQEVMEERKKLFTSLCHGHHEIYNTMKSLPGTHEEEDDPTTLFKKGVKLGKQLERKPDRHRWEVLQDFWAKKIIHAAASHYTTKEHMQHLENGGEFLTHIWALLAHAGILSLNRNRDHQEGQTNLESGPSAAA